jgi:hypothetical protein
VSAVVLPVLLRITRSVTRRVSPAEDILYRRRFRRGQTFVVVDEEDDNFELCGAGWTSLPERAFALLPLVRVLFDPDRANHCCVQEQRLRRFWTMAFVRRGKAARQALGTGPSVN